MVWLSLPTCKAVFIGNNSPKSGFRRMASPCVMQRSGGGPQMGVGSTATEKENKKPRKSGNCKNFEFKFDILHLY